MRAKTRTKKILSLLLSGAFFLFSLAFFAFFAPNSHSVQAAADKTSLFSVRLSHFSTWYSQKDVGRCENVALAARFIDGVTVQPYGEFSFNQTVGKRTAAAGFQNAKVIVKGEYVQGIGGGVCQVSTTLYNALLLAGLTVTEANPHSLAVSYVPPSRDAMVSTQSDLRFFNPYPFAVRLNVTAKQGSLTVNVYGAKKTDEYKIVAIVTGEIDPPAPLEKEETPQTPVQPREERKGIKSEAYLERYKGGALVSRKKLREDTYAPVQGIIVKKIDDTTKKIPSNACLFFSKML